MFGMHPPWPRGPGVIESYLDVVRRTDCPLDATKPQKEVAGDPQDRESANCGIKGDCRDPFNPRASA
jgi:hypothetical protein